MQAEQLWLMLIDLARRLDIEVRLERLEAPELVLAGGGLCLIRGRRVVFIDKHLNQEARLRQLAVALHGQDWEQHHMLPALRVFLDSLEGA